MSDDSGRVWVESDTIHYRSPHDLVKIPIPDLKVIAEHTDCSGPYADDYFLVFLTADSVFEISFYASGRDELLRALSSRLGYDLKLGLIRSADLASRVLWPREMEGQPFLEFSRRPDPFRFWPWLLGRLGLMVQSRIRPEILQRLR